MHYLFNPYIRDSKGGEKQRWEELLLQSLFDARQYLLNFPDKELSGWLMAVLTFYFKKLVAPLEIQAQDDADLWNEVFDEEGNTKIDPHELRKTNMYNTLEAYQIEHFKRFMGLLYCSENGADDFIDRNMRAIQVYVIYMSLELSKIDSRPA